MKITWDWSPENETLRLIQTSRNIAIGFHRFHNFIVSDNYSPNANSVVFPKLDYLSIPRFWDQVKKIDTHTFPFPVPTSLVSAVSHLTSFTPPDYISIQKALSQNQKQIFTEITRLVPEFKNIREIIVMPTKYGTTCSFSIEPQASQIYIWLRQDSSLIHIIEAILSSLTRQKLYDELGANWTESEIVIDYFISSSETFKKLDPNWKSALTISATRTKQNGLAKKQSDAYVFSLGAPLVTPDTLQQIDPTVFPAQQQQIFKLLLDKAPNIVTTDEIIDHLYPNDPDKFSLYAIAKQIQRLRDLLEKRGISGSFIQTKRGEGYFIAN